MITRRRAFHGDSQLSTLSAILRDEPEPVTHLVPGLPRDWTESSTAAYARIGATVPDHGGPQMSLEELKKISIPARCHRAPHLAGTAFGRSRGLAGSR
jgi:hypothetical protein